MKLYRETEIQQHNTVPKSRYQQCHLRKINNRKHHYILQYSADDLYRSQYGGLLDNLLLYLSRLTP